jgi:hypothetical protein
MVFRFIPVVYGVHAPSFIFTSILLSVPDNRSFADILSVPESINTVIDGAVLSYVREEIYVSCSVFCSIFPAISVADTLISYVPSNVGVHSYSQSNDNP